MYPKREDGRESFRMNVILSPDVHDYLVQFSKSMNISKSSAVNLILSQHKASNHFMNHFGELLELVKQAQAKTVPDSDNNSTKEIV